jgi:hypothetical protein
MQQLLFGPDEPSGDPEPLQPDFDRPGTVLVPLSASVTRTKLPRGNGWAGFIREADAVWRLVAVCRAFEACWDALLTYPGEGDRLAQPTWPSTLPRHA